MQNDTIRVRLVSRAAIYGSMLHRHRIKKRKLIAGWAFLTALIVVSTTILQTYFTLKPPDYTLDPKYHSLVGLSRDDTPQYLQKNKAGTAYDFALPETPAASEASEHTGRVADAYSASLSIYAREGITVTDTASKIAVTLTPDFYTGPGQKVDGDHIVYPHGSTRLVYTLKYNGLKEDIILPEAPRSGEASFSFKLSLPSGVEARLDDQGNIGIYSSDPTLFGNISFGSDEDRAKVDKARESSAKTNLVMTIPYPVVKDASGKEHTDKSKFTLGQKQTKTTKQAQKGLPEGAPKSLTTTNSYDLTIESKNLKDLQYPIAIDPTMQVAATGNFNGINDETGITNETTQITRQSLSGGSTGSFGSESDLLPANTIRAGSTTYNGFIYTAGGSSSNINKLQWAPIGDESSTNNATGTWSSTTLLTNHERTPGVVAYNGFLYVMGGLTATSDNGSDAVEYAKINSDGSISAPPGGSGCGGSWCTTTNLPIAAGGLSAVANNGYIYIAGGCEDYSNLAGQSCNSDANISNQAYRVPINANGTLGSWTQVGMPNSGTMPARLFVYKAAVWNNYYYIVGGRSTSSNPVAAVYYAKINSDGTMGSSWQTGTSMPVVRAEFGLAISSGYMYVVSGGNGSSGTYTDMIYAQINADGSLGTGVTATTWKTTGANVVAGAWDGSAVALKKGIAFIGGNNGCAGNNCRLTQYAAFKNAGELHTGAWSTGTSMAGAGRYGSATTVYNGYIYVIGGCVPGSLGARCAGTAAVDYTSINADGSLGTWQTTTPGVLVASYYANVVAYNGVLYVLPGCISSGSDQCSGGNNNTYSSVINATTGAPGSWSAETTTPTNFAYEKAFTYGDKLYFTGGCTPNDFSFQAGICATGYVSKKTYVATMNSAAAAGSRLSAWTDAGRDLPITLGGFGLATYGNYVFTAGGWDGTNRVSNVYYTSFDSSGNLQAWQSAGNNLPTAVMGHSLVAYNGYLYSYGGCTTVGGQPFDACSGGAVATVNMAKINTNGTVGTWQATQPMNAAQDRFAGVVSGGTLYVIGGTTTGQTNTYLTTSTYQQINNGGSGKLTSWTSGNSTNAQTRFGHASVAYNGYLYVTGGCGSAFLSACTSQRIDIQYAAINADGSLGNWATAPTTMPAGAYFITHAIAVYQGYMYITSSQNGAASSNTYSVQIGANGNITAAWQPQTSLNTPVVSSGYAVLNGRWYIAGGYNASSVPVNTIMFATLQPNGGLSAWTISSGNQNFTTVRGYTAMVSYKDYLYVIGGCNNASSGCPGGFLNDIQYTQITNSDGSISTSAGTWKTINTGIHIGFHFAGLGTYNGYLYIVGGNNELGNGLQRTLYAPILPDGNLGSITTVGQDAASLVGEARYAAGSAIYNGRMYITGGTLDYVNMHATNRYTTLQSIPRTGSFSKKYDFDVGVKPTKLITRGAKQTGAVVGLSYGSNVSCNNSVFDNTSTSSDIGYTGANALSIALGSNRTLARCLFVRYSIDDTYSAVFPDSGNESSISDFDAYYTANPGRRLRNGRTFTTGNDGRPADRGLGVTP